MNNGFTIVSSIHEIGSFINDLIVTEDIGLDTESVGLDYFNDKFLLLQVCVNNHIYIFNVEKLGEHLNYIVDLVNESKKVCIGHNIKYDIKVLKVNTDILIYNVFDTMVIEGVLTAGLGNNFSSLAGLLNKYLGIELDKDIRDDFIGANTITQEMYLYSALDVKHLNNLRKVMETALVENKLMQVANVENKLVPIVAQMEYNGVLINDKLWNKLTNSATRKVDILKTSLESSLLDNIKSKLKKKNALEMLEFLSVPVTLKRDRVPLQAITDFDYAFSQVKSKVNFGSHKQLLRILQLNGIPAKSTNAKDLDHIKNEYPILNELMSFKEYSKKISSFGTEFVQKINPKTGRLHCNFNQLGTSTGRWSSDSPNLQQIPRVKDKEDKDYESSLYRKCFIARPGYKLLTVDYNQAELRLLGAVSGEPEFIRAYQEERDLHQLTGSYIFFKEFEEVTKDERWIAKQVNFAIGYGSTEYGLYYNFGIPIDEGREHIKNFFKAYPYIKYFVDYAGEIIWERKYSVTPYGRKRFFDNKYLFDTSWEAKKYKASIIRKGVNHIIQGGSADILKLSFIDIYYDNPFEDGLRILMSVHDEGVYEVREDIVNDAIPFVMEIMESTEQKFLGEIPAKADYTVGDYWSK